MTPTKDQLNRFIVEKVLGFKETSIKADPKCIFWSSSGRTLTLGGDIVLRGQEDFFNDEGRGLVLRACEKMEIDPKNKLASILIERRHTLWFCAVCAKSDFTLGLSNDTDFDKALFTTLWKTFGGGE